MIFNTKKILTKASVLVLPLLSSISFNVVASGNFTMLDAAGKVIGGTNDIVYTWDQSVNTAESDLNFNMTIASAGPTPFFGAIWTVHHARVFGPGTYSFDTGCTVAEIEATGCAAGSAAASGPAISITVAADQVGVHMLFDYNGNFNIDIVNVYDQNTSWVDATGQGDGNGDLYLGPAGIAPVVDGTWKLVSTDFNNDGFPSTPMLDGPFTSFYANFNLGLALACHDITFATNPDVPLKITIEAELLSNCAGGDGAAVSLFSITQPAQLNATVADNGAGILTYTPAAGFLGDDSFDYTVTDASTNATARVNVSVGNVPGNLTLMAKEGQTYDGANNVVFDWDGTVNTAEANTNFNMAITFESPYVLIDKLHHIRVFGPGSYSFDSGCTVVEIEATGCPAGSAANSGPAVSMTVAEGQLGAHMMLDFNPLIGADSSNVDIVNVWDINAIWNDPDGTSSSKNNLFTWGTGAVPTIERVWGLVSRDVNGDGVNGAPMVEGVLTGNYMNFSDGNVLPDSDGDGVLDYKDAFPNDPTKTVKAASGDSGGSFSAFVLIFLMLWSAFTSMARIKKYPSY